MSELKSICYRGGIACFEIPNSWKEEYDPAGGATFYEDTANSGTLRLNVISFDSNGKETSEEMIASLIKTSGYKSLHEGLAIKQYVTSATENDEQLQIYFWEVAVPVKPCSARLAIFSYTMLASQANDRVFRAEIELVETSVRNGEYSRAKGVSGDYEHE